MQPAARLSSTQRNRALGRLRTLTVGTALASTAATGAFGFLAVITNPGTQVTGDSANTTTAEVSEAIDSTANSSSTAGSSSTSSAGSSSDTSTAAISTPSATTALASAATAPTTTTRHAHASSVGS